MRGYVYICREVEPASRPSPSKITMSEDIGLLPAIPYSMRIPSSPPFFPLLFGEIFSESTLFLNLGLSHLFMIAKDVGQESNSHHHYLLLFDSCMIIPPYCCLRKTTSIDSAPYRQQR
jgi:hypothetical protein